MRRLRGAAPRLASPRPPPLPGPGPEPPLAAASRGSDRRKQRCGCFFFFFLLFFFIFPSPCLFLLLFYNPQQFCALVVATRGGSLLQSRAELPGAGSWPSPRSSALRHVGPVMGHGGCTTRLRQEKKTVTRLNCSLQIAHAGVQLTFRVFKAFYRTHGSCPSFRILSRNPGIVYLP